MCFNGYYDYVKNGGSITEPTLEKGDKLDHYCAHIWLKVPCMKESKEGLSAETSPVSAMFSLYLLFSIIVFTSIML